MIFTLLGESAKAYAYPELVSVETSSFIRHIIQSIYSATGLDNVQSAQIVYMIGWWGHISCVLFFTAYLPTSKHAHLIWAPVNFFYQSGEPKGALSYIDIENASVWGSANVQHFEWPSLLDGLACIECGRCTIQCPANVTDKVLNPKEIMTDLKHALMDKNT